jgi:2-hydroxychromene-2-carboxylate isomerase
MAQPKIQFWFEFASTYSYLSAMRIDALAHAAHVEVEWKPFLLGPIFGAQGWRTSPFNIYPDKGAHMWRDMERRCAAQGLSFVHPDPFPQNSLLAARLTMVGLDEGWGEAFARGVYEVEFAHGLNIASERVLEGILVKAGADPAEAFDLAKSQATKDALKAQTEEAIANHVFGAPTFIVPYTAEIDGLHEWIVAAPNQQAALDAFGVNQNLFAQGEAGVTIDPALMSAAEAKPGVPLRRMKGSKGAFEEAAGGADWRWRTSRLRSRP